MHETQVLNFNVLFSLPIFELFESLEDLWYLIEFLLCLAEAGLEALQRLIDVPVLGNDLVLVGHVSDLEIVYCREKFTLLEIVGEAALVLCSCELLHFQSLDYHIPCLSLVAVKVDALF